MACMGGWGEGELERLQYLPLPYSARLYGKMIWAI